MKRIFYLFVLLFSTFAFAVDDFQINRAIETDDVNYIRKNIESGQISASQVIRAEPYPQIPIISVAARSASIKVLKYLIDNKADLNALDSVKETALMLAAYFPDSNDQNAPNTNHEKAVQLLLEAGANPDNIPNEYTPLCYAAYQGHTKIVEMLLQYKANVNAPAVDLKTARNTPLMMTAINGNLKTLLVLLKAGANAKILNAQGNSALMLAKQYNHTEMSKYLICAEGLQQGQDFSAVCL